MTSRGLPRIPDIPSGLPDEFVAHLRSSFVVLWGCDIESGYFSEPAPPSRRELARYLAKSLGIENSSDNLEEVAEWYELEFGRHRLVTSVLEMINNPTHHTNRLTKIMADLPVEAIVTTSQDELLEIAFREKGRKITPIVSTANLAFAEVPLQGADMLAPMLIKLRGTVSNPNTLVLTNEDHIQMRRHLSRLLDIVHYLFVIRPLLIIGHHPQNMELKVLYSEAIEGLGHLNRRAFMIWPGASDLDRKYWIQRNVDIIDIDPISAMEAIRAIYPHPSREVAHLGISGLIDKDPYKFLDYYDFDDADIFFGRESESNIMFRFILSRNLAILFGESGVGKTSLLKAGITSKLKIEGYEVLYIRIVSNPFTDIRQAAIELISKDTIDITIDLNADIAVLFDILLLKYHKLVVILDQFEQIYFFLDLQGREKLFLEINNTLYKVKSEIRFVLAIRQDFYPLLFEGYIVQFLQGNAYRLLNLSEDKAYLSITEPANRVGVSIDPQLVNVLLSEHGILDGQSLTVSPASLQIVCDQLYRRSLANNGGQRMGAEMTLATYTDLGGSKVILADYMELVLKELPRHEIPVAREILKTMVTTQETKRAISSTRLWSILDTLPSLSDTKSSFLYETVSNKLVNRRLVRAFEKNGEVFYELIHDYMASHVLDWMSKLEIQAQRIQELIQRELESWLQVGIRKLMERGTLSVINEYRESLWHLRPEELKLILLSSINHNIECDYWIERVSSAGLLLDIEQELIDELIKVDNPITIILQLSHIKTVSMAQKLTTISNNEFRNYPIEREGGLTVNLGRQKKLTILDVKSNHHRRALAVLAKMDLQITIQHLQDLTPLGMVLVPAGEFVLGSEEYPGEGPEHTVWLDSFYIKQQLVTNIEYLEFIESGGYENKDIWTRAGWLWKEQNYRQGPSKWENLKHQSNYPVVGVSWYEAVAYSLWSGGALPNEVEWEKAASFDPVTRRKYRYPWGDIFDETRCNTNASNLNGATPVGAYSPTGDSFVGCSDMAGNVWEWCSSISAPYPYRGEPEREDLEATGVLRIKRGGSYEYNPILSRSTFRLDDGPSRSELDQGFRYVIRL